MKTTELRIGNLVKLYFDKGSIIIDAIGKDGINTNLNGSYYDLDDIEPIPLTEEWLENNLSEYIDGSSGSEYGRFIPCGGRLYIQVVEEPYLSDVKGEKKILEPKYVHQLQNLYFALTGQELEIKQTVDG